MGRFSGVGGVQVASSRVDFKEGTYDLEVLEIGMFTSEKSGQEMFKVRLKVNAASSGALPVGAEPGWVVFMQTGRNAQYSLRDIKAFAAAVLGIANPDEYQPQGKSPEEFWVAVLDGFVSPEQPATGAKVKAVCVMTEPDKDGRSYPRMTWSVYK